MAKSNLNQIFVILCGGTGPRLWPLSTTSHPKQFLSILSDKSLLEQTIDRLLKITSPDKIYLTTSRKNLEQVIQSTNNKINPNNILVEPDKKNTALAVHFTLTQLSDADPETVVTFLPSDHFISPVNKFKNDLIKAAQKALDNSSLVTIGIHPTFPNTSFGYILHNHRFVEKPSKIVALKHIVNGALWNSGIYTATISTYLDEFNKHFPKPNYQKSVPISFDKAISEKSKKIEVIKASFDWNDVGEWGSIYHQSQADSIHIAVVNPQTKYLSQNSHHCLVSSENNDKLIGLVGVTNLAIIDTPQALLISSLDRSSEVRDLVTQIVNKPKLVHYFVDDQK